MHVFQALGSVIAPIVVRGISKNGPPAAEWAYLVLAVRSASQSHHFHLVLLQLEADPLESNVFVY